MKEFVQLCNECLFPNYRVNRYSIQKWFGVKTTFDLNDFKLFCGPTLADAFLGAKIKARREQEEIKEEKREAQR